MSVPCVRKDREAVICLICGADLPCRWRESAANGRCPNCRQALLCHRRDYDGVAVLELRQDHCSGFHAADGFCGPLKPPSDARYLVLNLAGMDMLTSTMLAAFVALKRRVEGSGARLVLCGLRPTTRAVFEFTRLDRYFEIADTESAAVQSIRDAGREVASIG